MFDVFREAGEPTAGGRFFQHMFSQARSDPPSSPTEARFTLVRNPASSAVDPQATLVGSMGAVPAAAFVVIDSANDNDAARAATPAAADLIAGTGSDNLEGDEAARTATVQFGTMTSLQGGGVFGGVRGTANYVVSYSEDLESALVYDSRTKTLLEGGPGNFPELGEGGEDTLELSGDYSVGFTLPPVMFGLDLIVLRAGNDYNLVSSEDNVSWGETLTVNAMPLGNDNHVMFDGSAETDGNFEFFGSQQGDFFFGGAGDDRIVGLGGGDTLTGGGGSDIFVYTGASESSSTDYDTIADFDPAADRIDLPGGVTGFGDAIEGGSLSYATFDDDLSAVLAGLEPAQAVWFAPDAGDLAGQIFLIVDGNGQAGYQEGEDFVIAVAGAPLTDLTGHTDIFI